MKYEEIIKVDKKKSAKRERVNKHKTDNKKKKKKGDKQRLKKQIKAIAWGK